MLKGTSDFSFASIFYSYSSFSRTRFQFLRTRNVYLGVVLASFFFLLTWTLSCEKNSASRPDGEDFSFSMKATGMTNSVLVGSSIET